MERFKRLMLPVVILLFAFAWRVLSIDRVPPGYTHDEFGDMDVASQVRAGDWQLLYAGGFAIDGSEPAYFPVLSAAQSIWGTNPLARHLPALLGGMLGLCAIYVLARRMFGRTVGILTLSTAAITWWSILIGRIVLREVLELPPYALALYFFWRGFQSTQTDRVEWRSFILGGLALGAAQYVHTIPRGLFMVLVLFGLYLLIFQRTLFKRAWRGILVCIVTAELIAAPLLIYAYTHPDIDHLPSLTSDEFDPNDTLPYRIQNNTPAILGQFMFAGDLAWEFNVPGRPIFDPVFAVIFAVGLLIALVKFRQPAYAFILIALGVSILPSILLDPNFPFVRMLSAQASAFAFVGISLNTIGSNARRFLAGRAYPIGLATGLVLVLGFGSIKTYQDMFVTWPSMYQTRWTFNAEYIGFYKYLNTQPQVRDVSECVLWIIYPWRPRYHASLQQDALQHVTDRSDLKIRWQDCRSALVIPNGGQFIFAHPDLQPLSNFLGRFLSKPWFDQAAPIQNVAGALNVDTRSALAAQQKIWDRLPVSWPPEASIASTATLPIDFDHSVELIGYTIKPKNVKAGGNLAVVTYWRVIGPVPDDLILFTHVYSTPDHVIAQQDQLDVNGSSLQVGDIFIQQHEFISIPADTPAGQYTIGVGAYHKDSGQRLPIYIGNQRAADRVFLTQIQVKP